MGVQLPQEYLDKIFMWGKFILLGMLANFSVAMAQESSVYLCSRAEETSEYVIRLKKYFDSNVRTEIGKIDRLYNSEVVESVIARVYQIPLLDQKSYVQVWHAGSVTVDAQLNYDQGHRIFSATYKQKSEKLNLICYKLPASR